MKFPMGGFKDSRYNVFSIHWDREKFASKKPSTLHEAIKSSTSKL